MFNDNFLNGLIIIANIIEEGRYGGPQARITRVAECLKANEGIDTLIIAPAQESERFSSEAGERDIPIHTLNMRRLSRSPRSIIKYFATFAKEVCVLCKLMKKVNADLVHCNNTRQYKGVVAAKLSGKKVIWHLQDTSNPKLIKALFFLLAPLADSFIVAGKRVGEYYLKNPFLRHNPAKTIQAPVQTGYFNPAECDPDPRMAAPSGLNIVSVGNINPIKGYEYFIEAAAILSKIDKNLNFWIVGKNYKNQIKYFQKLQRLTQDKGLDNFRFYGPSSEVRTVLKAADIYVCSSIAEASPISVWEAMSMKKAIVSTDVGDVKRFVKNDDSGFIVPIRDSKALADRIKMLIQDANLREKLGERARSIAIESLDISICAKRHMEIYTEILSKTN